MTSPEEKDHFVERREYLLESPTASQISTNKTLLTEFRPGLGDDFIFAKEIHSSVPSDHHTETLTKRERSEVNVEIQGLRETAFSCSETVVTSRVKTVYDRSLSGSTSSTDLDDRSLAESQHEAEDAVFGEGACIDGEQRSRKTSDSYYISQTYQVNTVERSSRSVTAVRSVSFRSSKDVPLGHHEKASLDSDLHYVDRLEEIIAGQEPNSVGSPKEKHVRFLWYDIDHLEDADTLSRMQSAREDIQHLIETTYMVSDIADVVDDNHMGPESRNLTTSTSGDSQLSGDSLIGQPRGEKSEQFIEQANQKPDLSAESARSHDSNIISYAATEASQAIYGQTVSASEVAQVMGARPSSSSQITWGFSTTFPPGGRAQSLDPLLASNTTTRPTSLTESIESLAAGRSSPPTLTYSPGMAIRNYALEELVEKKHLVAADRKKTETRDPVKQDHSSNTGPGVEVSLMNSCSITQVTSESISNHTYASSNDSSSVQEISKEDADESLDKLVDLESLQVGYRFHDIGIMQETGGICNLAFDDSDEHDSVLVSIMEHTSASHYPVGLANIDVSLTEAVPVQSSEVLSRSNLPTESTMLTTSTQGSHSALENSSLSVTGTTIHTLTTNFDQDTARLTSAVQESPIETKPPFISEESTHTTTVAQKTRQSESTSYSKQVEHSRTTMESVSQTRGNAGTVSVEEVEHAAEAHDGDESLIVQELDSIIQAGERVIQELAQSLEEGELEAWDSRDSHSQTKAEDNNWFKDPEIKGYAQAREAVTITREAENITRESDSKTIEADRITTAREAGNTTTTKETEKTHKKAKNKNKNKNKETKSRTHIKEDVNIVSTFTNMSTVTQEVGSAVSPTEIIYARSLIETEEARQFSTVGTATISSAARGSDVKSLSLLGGTKYSGQARDAESITRTSEVLHTVHTKQGGQWYGPDLRNRSQETSDLVKDETLSTSQATQEELVSQISGSSDIETTPGDVKVTGGSVSVMAFSESDTTQVKPDDKTPVESDDTRGKAEKTRAKKAKNKRGKVENFEARSNEDVASRVTNRSTRAANVKEMSLNEVGNRKLKNPELSESVTRKFNVSPKFEATLRAQGAVLMSESITIAVYYDNPSYDLTLADCWLRSVNSKWQLHSNFTKLLNNSTKDEYTESEEKGTILSFLAALLERPVPKARDVSVAEYIQRAGLREFVRYTTIKKTYQLRGLTIDLELPEYGFWVGTVTAKAPRLHDAVSNINSIWTTAGVQALNLLVD